MSKFKVIDEQKLTYPDWQEICRNQPMWADIVIPAPKTSRGLLRGTVYALALAAPLWVGLLVWILSK